jgi:lipoprotein-anchoring transpeptidase ErfK/SrfK
MEQHKVIKTDEEIDVRQPVQLDGRYRTKYKIRYFKLKEGDLWVRFKDLIYVPKRHEFPDFAGTNQKWIDVSLATQRLIAWQGKTPVFATVISSGEDRIGDPETGPATKQGVFRIRAKHITANIDDREVRHRYSVTEVPWVMDFEEGHAITGCYWHEQFGESRSYHNIALSPIDARYLFNWAGPTVPEGWHSANFDENDAGAIIYVHK